jgi:hypothetical protein
VAGVTAGKGRGRGLGEAFHPEGVPATSLIGVTVKEGVGAAGAGSAGQGDAPFGGGAIPAEIGELGLDGGEAVAAPAVADLPGDLLGELTADVVY